MKRTIIIITLIACSTFVTYGQNINVEQSQYTSLTQEQFNFIEDEFVKKNVKSPILLEEIPRDELLKFYVESYVGNDTDNWAKKAYLRLEKQNLIKKGSNQDKKVLSLLEEKQSKSIIFNFLSVLTNKQILGIGY